MSNIRKYKKTFIKLKVKCDGIRHRKIRFYRKEIRNDGIGFE